MTQATLIEQILHQLDMQLTSIEPPIAYKIITEKEAAFSCEVGSQKLRPHCLNPIINLYLAGDYTNTGYPSTLEGAVMSGHTAAAASFSRGTLDTPRVDEHDEEEYSSNRKVTTPP